MTNDVFGCWYEPGDAGTWLSWFINQHEGYPKFDKKIRYEQEGNPYGQIPSDYACPGSNWHLTDFQSYDNVTLGPNETRLMQSLEFKDFKKNLEVKNITHERDYINLCYKIIPWHNPIHTDRVGYTELKKYGIELTADNFIKKIIRESNTKAVIIPETDIYSSIFAKRLAFIRPEFTVGRALDIYKARKEYLYQEIAENVSKYVTVHRLFIDKLVIKNDREEYLKLLDILQVPELEDWTSHTGDYYKKFFKPWENILNSALNKRPETKQLNNVVRGIK